MKKIAIAIDPWKQPIFERHLTAAGYAFETKQLSPQIKTIFVKAKFASDVQKIVEAAQKECADAKTTR